MDHKINLTNQPIELSFWFHIVILWEIQTNYCTVFLHIVYPVISLCLSLRLMQMQNNKFGMSTLKWWIPDVPKLPFLANIKFGLFVFFHKIKYLSDLLWAEYLVASFRVSHVRSTCFQKLISIKHDLPVDTGRKLNVQDVFWTSYVRSYYVLCSGLTLLWTF